MSDTNTQEQARQAHTAKPKAIHEMSYLDVLERLMDEDLTTLEQLALIDRMKVLKVTEATAEHRKAIDAVVTFTRQALQNVEWAAFFLGQGSRQPVEPVARLADGSEVIANFIHRKPIKK